MEKSTIPTAAAPNKFFSNTRLLNIAVLPFCRTSRSISASCFPGSMLPANAEVPLHGVAVDHAAESEHVPCFGFEHDVTHVDRAFDSARLVWTFEMSGKRAAVLNQGHRVSAGFSVITLGVDDPVAGHIVRWTILR